MVLSFLVNNSDTKKCKVLIGPHWPSWSSDLLIPDCGDCIVMNKSTREKEKTAVSVQILFSKG